MLVVRAEQMKVFEQDALRRFEDEMVAHSKEFTPRLCEVIGDDQLRVALRQAIDRAGTYGFTNQGPVRLYIELMFLCGSDFDTDPQYSAVADVLNASGDQMQRAEQIYDGILEYQEKVSGLDAANTRKALDTLSIFARMPITFCSNEFVTGILQEMAHAFPQKVVYIGEEALTALVYEGQVEARRYHLPTVRGEALVVVLMFAFGHGCTDDPLYPWIARTLRDERITDGVARAQRLEKKALTWLDHVLTLSREGAQG